MILSIEFCEIEQPRESSSQNLSICDVLGCYEAFTLSITVAVSPSPFLLLHILSHSVTKKNIFSLTLLSHLPLILLSLSFPSPIKPLISSRRNYSRHSLSPTTTSHVPFLRSLLVQPSYLPQNLVPSMCLLLHLMSLSRNMCL